MLERAPWMAVRQEKFIGLQVARDHGHGDGRTGRLPWRTHAGMVEDRYTHQLGLNSINYVVLLENRRWYFAYT